MIVIIDPAINPIFVLAKSTQDNLTEEMVAEGKDFWPKFNIMLEKIQSMHQSITFYINFGPGSYTGLKLSRIMAESLKMKGFDSRIFYHYDLLKMKSSKYLLYCSPAYKKQFFLAHLSKEVLSTNLIDQDHFEEYCLNEKISQHQIIFSQDMPNHYRQLDIAELKQVSSVVGQQQLMYYRLPQEDYKVSQHG